MEDFSVGDSGASEGITADTAGCEHCERGILQVAGYAQRCQLVIQEDGNFQEYTIVLEKKMAASG